MSHHARWRAWSHGGPYIRPRRALTSRRAPKTPTDGRPRGYRCTGRRDRRHAPGPWCQGSGADRSALHPHPSCERPGGQPRGGSRKCPRGRRQERADRGRPRAAGHVLAAHARALPRGKRGPRRHDGAAQRPRHRSARPTLRATRAPVRAPSHLGPTDRPRSAAPRAGGAGRLPGVVLLRTGHSSRAGLQPSLAASGRYPAGQARRGRERQSRPGALRGRAPRSRGHCLGGRAAGQLLERALRRGGPPHRAIWARREGRRPSRRVRGRRGLRPGAQDRAADRRP